MVCYLVMCILGMVMCIPEYHTEYPSLHALTHNRSSLIDITVLCAYLGFILNAFHERETERERVCVCV